MKHKSDLVYSVVKFNGTNYYTLSIVHKVYDHPVDFGTLGLVSDVYVILYSWKNSKCSKPIFCSFLTKTLAESMTFAEKKFKQLDEKIN